jgi:hypothetical protein
MAVEAYANSPLISSPSTAWTTVNGALDASTTTVVPVSASAFPASGQYRIAIDNELLLVTAGAGTLSWTVQRGAEGTTAATHASGASIYGVLTAASLLRSPGALTDTGDVPYLASTGAPTRLAAGADGTYLRYASGVPTTSAPLMADLSGSSIVYGTDTTFGRGAAAGQMTLSAGATSPSLRLQNGSNAELGCVYWDSNNFVLGTQGAVGAGTARDTILSGAAAVILATQGTSRWTLDAATGHLRPWATATYDLGTASQVVRSAYVAKLGTLTSDGVVATSGGDGTLSVITNTGTGNNVLATSPTLTTPVLGVASATSLSLASGTSSAPAIVFSAGEPSGTTGFYYSSNSIVVMASDSPAYFLTFNFFNLTRDAAIQWCGQFDATAATDLVIRRDAADTLAQRRSTNAQTFRLYNTFTDSSNYERATLNWASNILHIGTANAGTGTARVLQLDYGGTTTAAISIPITSGNVTIAGNTFTAGTYTLTGAASKVLTFNNSLTLAGTDSTTMTFPTTSATIARTDAANTFTGSQTFSGVLLGPDGASSAPAYSSTNYPTSGLTFQSGIVKIYQGGNECAAFQGTGQISYLTQVTLGGGNDLHLRRNAAATLQLGVDLNGAAISQQLQACNGITGTDKTGGNLTLASGKGTGAGAVSSLIFQTPTVLSTGTTAQSLATRVTIDSSGLTLNSGGLIQSGKTLAWSNTLTLAGTDSTTMTFPSTSATIARTDAANTFTGNQTFSGPTANSTQLTVSGGSLTGSDASTFWSLAGTWNTSGAPVAFLVNITNTASSASSLIFDWQVSTTTQLKLTRGGILTAASNVQTNGGGFVLIDSTKAVQWRNGSTTVFSDANNQLDQRNTTNAQTYNLYSTWSSATNYEVANLLWSSSVFHIGTNKGSGGGTARVMQLDYGGTTTAAISVPISSGQVTFGGGLISGGTITHGANFMEFTEMTAPSAGATNNVRIYAQDNGSGKTQLMAVFPTGSAVQLAIEP